MKLVDVGTGPPLVIVPGIQGRWEWMKPAVNALAARCRVVTFSLADEPTCGGRFDERRGFDCYVEQIAEAMDAAHLSTACICGVSYGGLVAAAFAARHPERVSGLVLVSALPPTWRPDGRVRFYLRAPRLLSPLFFLNSLRMYREIAAATPGVLAGMREATRHALNVLAHMLSPARMARRVRLLQAVDLARELQAIAVPSLIVTGDAQLDRVVPVRLTDEYLRICRGAERVTIGSTGHLGSITRPEEFAGIVGPFVVRHSAAAPPGGQRDDDGTEEGAKRRCG
jgi:pimeloyl-ACP methyl ester carboxylesterase